MAVQNSKICEIAGIIDLAANVVIAVEPLIDRRLLPYASPQNVTPNHVTARKPNF